MHTHRMVTPHARSSLRSQQPSLVRFAHALLPARFACAPRLLASLAFLACCSLRSPARSLRSPLLPLLVMPLVASPARCSSRCIARRLSCWLAPLAASPAPLASFVACCSLRSPRRLPLASLAAGRSACCSLRSRTHLRVLLASSSIFWRAS